MRIVLNADLQPVEIHEYTAKTRAERRASGHKEFAEQFIRDLRGIAAPVDPTDKYSKLQAQVVRGLGDHEMTQLGFARAVSEAYSTHKGLILHPHDIWYVVLSNITAIVAEKPDAYRGIYTESDAKQQILVLQDHPTDINIENLAAALGRMMPVDVSLFLPELSTATPQATAAMSAAVLDAAQHYYDYGMFCCGIPFIDLRGTWDDWNTMFANLINIGFAAVGDQDDPVAKARVAPLTKYIAEASAVILEIKASYHKDQTEFWKDIFTQENIGSGRDLKVTGWICELYHGVKRGSMIKTFHDGVSQVPYKNFSTGQHFMMFHGPFGSNVVDGALEIAYDHVTIEYNPKEG